MYYNLYCIWQYTDYSKCKKIPEVKKCNGAMKDLSSIERQRNFLYTDYED